MTTLTTHNHQPTSKAPTYRIFIALAFIAFILIGANDGAVGVLIPTFQSYYQLNKSMVGLLFFFSVSGYLISTFNTGLLVARLGEKGFLICGIGIFLLGTILVSIAPSFIFLLFSMTLIGFGIGVIDAGFNAFIARIPRSTALLNYLHAFYGIGALLGPLVASTTLALKLPWNVVYMAWVGISTLLILTLSVAVKDWQSVAHSETSKSESSTSTNIFTTTLKIRVVWFAALFLLFYVGSEVSLGTWSYSFLTEERHWPVLPMSWVVSGYWLGLTLGRLTLAHLALQIEEKRLIQICLAGVIIGILLVWFVPVEMVSAFGLCLTGFSLGPIFPTTIALLSRLVPPHLLPGSVGFAASLGSMGAALFPWLVGNLAQAIGLWSLLPFIIALTALMLIFWLALRAASHST